MSTLLVKNIDVLVTMDVQRREIKDGAIYVEDNVISQVGSTAELEANPDLKPDRIINGRGSQRQNRVSRANSQRRNHRSRPSLPLSQRLKTG